MDKPQLYCYCRQPYDDNIMMIGCDNCNEWYHVHCVGLTVDDVSTIGNWYCPTCVSLTDTRMMTPSETTPTSDITNVTKKNSPDIHPISNDSIPETNHDTQLHHLSPMEKSNNESNPKMSDAEKSDPKQENEAIQNDQPMKEQTTTPLHQDSNLEPLIKTESHAPDTYYHDNNDNNDKNDNNDNNDKNEKNESEKMKDSIMSDSTIVATVTTEPEVSAIVTTVGEDEERENDKENEEKKKEEEVQRNKQKKKLEFEIMFTKQNDKRRRRNRSRNRRRNR